MFYALVMVVAACGLTAFITHFITEELMLKKLLAQYVLVEHDLYKQPKHGVEFIRVLWGEETYTLTLHSSEVLRKHHLVTYNGEERDFLVSAFPYGDQRLRFGVLENCRIVAEFVMKVGSGEIFDLDDASCGWDLQEAVDASCRNYLNQPER